MTLLEARAQQEAMVAIDSARRRHELAALIDHRAGRAITAQAHAAAARRLRRYGPGEILSIDAL